MNVSLSKHILEHHNWKARLRSRIVHEQYIENLLPDQVHDLESDRISFQRKWARMCNTIIGTGEGPAVQDCMIVVNEGKEDELHVWGYKNNLWKFLTTLMMILMTGGLLGLILYWMKHYWLYFTQDLCSLKEATTVLVVVSSN